MPDFADCFREVVCFLNPGYRDQSNVFAPMLGLLRTDRRIGMQGCRLLNTDLTLQTSCILPFPTLANQLFDIEWLKRRTPRWRLGAWVRSFRGRPPQEVEAVSGACMVVPRRVFEQVKGFSEDYFMYSEDVDLCYKISHAGYAVIYNPTVELIHHGEKRKPYKGKQVCHGHDARGHGQVLCKA